MQDAAIKAYARAFCVVAHELEQTGKYNIPKLIDRCAERPYDGFTQPYLMAIRENVLTSKDIELISSFFEDVDPDDELHLDRPLSQEKQGMWLLEYMHWREMYTPAQAAEKLGVTKQRISALIKDRKLQAVKCGGSYYISGASVNMRAKERERAKSAGRE